MSVGELEGWREVISCKLVGFRDATEGATVGKFPDNGSIVSAGILLGICDGNSLCVREGSDVGISVRSFVGWAEPFIVGGCDAFMLGVSAGFLLEICVVTPRLGCWEGNTVGKYFSLSVGPAELLFLLGDCDGSSLGVSVGALLEILVGKSRCVVITGVG